MLIDFKEIPKANTGNGDQDEFELFARDFLSEIGYTIVEEPARGADGGKDLIVTQGDDRKSAGRIRWLVSCKHHAHGGKAVGTPEEQNILDRTRAKKCDGFLGFYSTIPTEGLMTRLRELENDISHRVYDKGKIDSLITGYEEREVLFMRFFPESYKKWRGLRYHNEPVQLFNSYLARKHKNYIQLIENVFGKTENLIRRLNDFDTLEGVFGFQNLEVTVSEQAIENIFRMKTFEENSQPQETMSKILFQEIPQILLDEKGIDIRDGIYGKITWMPVIQNKIRKNSKTKATYIQNHPNEKDVFSVEFCVIYRNHIVLTDKLYKSVKCVFDDLRKMLVSN